MRIIQKMHHSVSIWGRRSAALAVKGLHWFTRAWCAGQVKFQICPYCMPLMMYPLFTADDKVYTYCDCCNTTPTSVAASAVQSALTPDCYCCKNIYCSIVRVHVRCELLWAISMRNMVRRAGLIMNVRIQSTAITFDVWYLRSNFSPLFS